MNGLFIPHLIQTTSGRMTEAFKSLAIPGAAVLGIPLKNKSDEDTNNREKITKSKTKKSVTIASDVVDKSVADRSTEDVGCSCGRYRLCGCCKNNKKQSYFESIRKSKRFSRKEDSLEDLNTFQNFYGYFGSVQPSFFYDKTTTSKFKPSRIKTLKFDSFNQLGSKYQSIELKCDGGKEKLVKDEKEFKITESGVVKSSEIIDNVIRAKGEESDGGNVNENNSLLVDGEYQMRTSIDMMEKGGGGKKFWKRKDKENKAKEVRIIIPGESTTTTTLITPIKKSPTPPSTSSQTSTHQPKSIHQPTLQPTSTHQPTLHPTPPSTKHTPTSTKSTPSSSR